MEVASCLPGARSLVGLAPSQPVTAHGTPSHLSGLAYLHKGRVPPYTNDHERLEPVSHTIKDKTKLLARIRRIKGQAEAVERALDAELGCTDVLMLVASMRGAINGLTAELMEDHIRHHVVNPDNETDPERAKGAADLIDVLRTYMK
jgi:DNA-binding FrmR family transcriptional regulator